MFDLDPTKILIILAIALLVIDPKRLPQVSRRVGRTVREFRFAFHNLTREVGAEEIVEDLRGLHQARGTFGQTIRTELGLDELAQSMNLDEHDEAQTTSHPSVVPETVGASSANAATAVPTAPKPVRTRAPRAKASEAADVVPPTAAPSGAAPANPRPVRKRPPKAKPEVTEAAPAGAASATSAAAPKPRRPRTRTAKAEPSESA